MLRVGMSVGMSDGSRLTERWQQDERWQQQETELAAAMMAKLIISWKVKNPRAFNKRQRHKLSYYNKISLDSTAVLRFGSMVAAVERWQQKWWQRSCGVMEQTCPPGAFHYGGPWRGSDSLSFLALGLPVGPSMRYCWSDQKRRSW
ncbi:unnamed protein product [Calypogeia fissa]